MLCPDNDSLPYLLQHVVQERNWGSGWWRLVECKVLWWWQPRQSTAPQRVHRGQAEAGHWSYLCWRCNHRRSYRRNSAAHHILLFRRIALAWPWCQPQENWRFSPAYSAKRKPTSSHHHWHQCRTEINTTAHLPGMNHVIWSKDWQRIRQWNAKHK